MKFKLQERRWLDLLSLFPESGMGYQIVDITLKDGRVIKKIKIINGETVEIPLFSKKFTEHDIKIIEPST